MTLDQLIQNPPTGVNGQYVDVDKEYGAQCWDLVELYAEDDLSVPKKPWAITLNGDGTSTYPDGNAKNAWLCFSHNPNLVAYFDQIPVGQAQRGDINVYNGHDTFPEGHINIELGNNQVFEQNADPDSSPAHVSTRPTTYLLGSLRLKGDFMNQQQAEELAQQIGLISADPNWNNQDWITSQAQHIMADPNYAAALIKQEYDSQRWQEFNYRAVHYDADVAAAGGDATVLAPGNYKVQ